MDRKFESDLAGRIARRHKTPLKNRTKVLVMTLISCAVIVGAAGVVLSMKATAYDGGPTEYTPLLSSEDYILMGDDDTLVYTDQLVEDENYLLRRASSLKAVEFNTPGNSPVIYTKWVYTVNVKVKDLSVFDNGIAGMVMSELSINGLEGMQPWIATATFTVDGVTVMEANSIEELDQDKYVALDYDGATATVTVTLPDISDTAVIGYEADDLVSVSVMLKTPYVDWLPEDPTGWDAPVVEIGFPDIQFPEVEEAPEEPPEELPEAL